MPHPSYRLLCTLFFILTSYSASAETDAHAPTDQQLSPSTTMANTTFREIGWDDLMPKAWDPASEFKKLDLAKLSDDDPRARDALAKMRALMANAPVEPSLNGTAIRLAGFIVPLEEKNHRISELLLVPYFGGCIHVPPPPGQPDHSCISANSTGGRDTKHGYRLD